MRSSLVILVILMATPILYAQMSVESGNSLSGSSAYYYSGATGSEQLKIYTYIWGQVKRTGLFIIPENTDLLALISLAGGPTEHAKLSRIQIIRPTNPVDKIIYVDMSEYIETGNDKLIPKLQPGDTVIVSGSIFYAFYQVADFMSKVFIVLSVITAASKL